MYSFESAHAVSCDPIKTLSRGENPSIPGDSIRFWLTELQLNSLQLIKNHTLSEDGESQFDLLLIIERSTRSYLHVLEGQQLLSVLKLRNLFHYFIDGVSSHGERGVCGRTPPLVRASTHFGLVLSSLVILSPVSWLSSSNRPEISYVLIRKFYWFDWCEVLFGHMRAELAQCFWGSGRFPSESMLNSSSDWLFLLPMSLIMLYTSCSC